MKKKWLSLLLALTLCLGLLPVGASAAQTDLPDWYFLFAVFKNVDADCKDRDGKTTRLTHSMTQKEIDTIKAQAQAFEDYMTQSGVMRAHVDVVEIDKTLKEFEERDNDSSLICATQAEPLLKDKVNLNQYDHVACIFTTDISTSYLGITPSAFENGTGISCINLEAWLRQRERTKEPPEAIYVHEYLHFMERMSDRWGVKFVLHEVDESYGSDLVAYYDDLILNRAKGTAGTGVHPAVWQYSPRIFRDIHEVTIPSHVTRIGDYAFQYCTTLNKVTIPSTVTSIGYAAFGDCTGLTEATMLPGVTSVGNWAFGKCSALTKVTIPASVTSIGEVAFYKTNVKDVYYGGTEAQWKAIKIGDFNEALTKANIHYNGGASSSSSSGVPAVTVDKIPAKGTAYASTQNITIDGRNVKFDAYALKDANGNLTNYVKLRDVAVALNGSAAQFEVGYDGTISLTTKTAYTGGSEMGTPFSGDRTYQGGAQSVKVNGQSVNMTAITLYDSSSNGYNYFKLRDLGAVLGFQVGYSNETGISINTAQ